MGDAPSLQIIVLHETVWRSWAKDAGTYVLIVAVIGTGWWLGTAAMEWLGFLMLLLAARRIARGELRMTPQEAADLLARKHGVVGQTSDA